MANEIRLWIIHTDEANPWWHALWCFKATEKQAESYFEFIKDNFYAVETDIDAKLPIFLKEIKEDKIYHLTKKDVEDLKTVQVDRNIGDEYFIDGDLCKNEIITAEAMKKMIARVKKEIKEKKS